MFPPRARKQREAVGQALRLNRHAAKLGAHGVGRRFFLREAGGRANEGRGIKASGQHSAGD